MSYLMYFDNYDYRGIYITLIVLFLNLIDKNVYESYSRTELV